MRNKVLISTLSIIILASVSALAQQSLFEGCSSAGVLDDPVMFNCDFYNPIGLPGVEVECHYRGQSDNEFTDLIMELMNEYPHYLFTYEAQAEFYENPDVLEYYFSGGTDTLKATQSPKILSDQFPPPEYMYAPFAADALGDTTEGSAGGWLDLAGSGMTYSDTRVYGYLENATNTWPSNQGLDIFMYALGFISLSSLDSSIYAMAYVDIPPFFTPGLYKLTIIDSSFEYVRLGDIDYAIENGLLHMACDLETFENDPDWPGWPPEGFIISIGGSVTIGFDIQTINDFTYPTFYEPVTQFTDFNSNNSPEIFDYDIEVVPGVSVTATINYYDPDNNLPTERSLFFNYGFYPMGSMDHTYSDTSEFEVTLAWPGEGWSYYYFRYSDGLDMVTTPTDSIYLTPIGIEDDQSLPRQFTLYQNYPNPFNASTTISFVLADKSEIDLTVYDITGRLVRNIHSGIISPGEHSFIWDGRSNQGKQLSSGVYFYKLQTGSNQDYKKMILLK